MSKIFIAEDDEFISRVYERAFKNTNHQLEIVHDGEQAMEALDKIEQLPDVIALDMVMPKASGLSVLKKIRETEKLKNLKVVMISNSIQDKDKDEVAKLGVSLFLTKMENTPDEIVKKLEEVIKLDK
jgi:two-component system, OmpR family, phosphate regulon response regulator PhoB